MVGALIPTPHRERRNPLAPPRGRHSGRDHAALSGAVKADTWRRDAAVAGMSVFAAARCLCAERPQATPRRDVCPSTSGRTLDARPSMSMHAPATSSRRGPRARPWSSGNAPPETGRDRSVGLVASRHVGRVVYLIREVEAWVISRLAGDGRRCCSAPNLGAALKSAADVAKRRIDLRPQAIRCADGKTIGTSCRRRSTRPRRTGYRIDCIGIGFGRAVPIQVNRFGAEVRISGTPPSGE